MEVSTQWAESGYKEGGVAIDWILLHIHKEGDVDFLLGVDLSFEHLIDSMSSTKGVHWHWGMMNQIICGEFIISSDDILLFRVQNSGVILQSILS
jgi:hypothetical protein